MGCDIHLNTERKIKGTWTNLHSNLGVSRNSKLFAILADVRNYDEVTPIAEPRGVPLDASKEYLWAVKDMDGDGHSHSYLTLQELIDYLPNANIKHSGMITKDQSAKLDAGELPNSWCRSTTDSSYVQREWLAPETGLISLVENLKLLQCDVPSTDIRIVFFFDN